MNYWLLSCDPRRYPLDERLEDPDPRMTWRVNRYQDDMMGGDVGFIWRASEGKGVCGVVQMSTSPEVVDRAEAECVDCVDFEFGNVYTVDVVLLDRGFLLPPELLREQPELSDMAVFREQTLSTAYRLSRYEATKLLELIAAGRAEP